MPGAKGKEGSDRKGTDRNVLYVSNSWNWKTCSLSCVNFIFLVNFKENEFTAILTSSRIKVESYYSGKRESCIEVAQEKGGIAKTF